MSGIVAPPVQRGQDNDVVLVEPQPPRVRVLAAAGAALVRPVEIAGRVVGVEAAVQLGVDVVGRGLDGAVGGGVLVDAVVELDRPLRL